MDLDVWLLLFCIASGIAIVTWHRYHLSQIRDVLRNHRDSINHCAQEDQYTYTTFSRHATSVTTRLDVLENRVSELIRDAQIARGEVPSRANTNLVEADEEAPVVKRPRVGKARVRTQPCVYPMRRDKQDEKAETDLQSIQEETRRVKGEAERNSAPAPSE